MRDQVLWRKQTRIVMLLAQTLNIDLEQALDIYYNSSISQQMANPDTGLRLMSDGYILEDLLQEVRTQVAMLQAAKEQAQATGK